MKKLLKILLLISSIFLLVSNGVKVNADYKVKKGDTLWSIAQDNNVKVEDLQKWNDLKNYNISIGQKVKTKKPIITKTHNVKKGDTIWSIAQKNKVKVKDIQKWNDLKNYNIKIGQKLKIKTNNSKKENNDDNEKDNNNNNNNSNNNSKSYKVKKGDTLWSISRKNKVSVEELMNWNNLKSTSISIDQKLELKKPKENAAKNERATTTDHLNLRKKSNTNAKIVLTIPKGKEVNVISKGSTWWEVKYNDKEGFVHSSYLTKNGGNSQKSFKAEVNATGLHLRKKGSTNSSSLKVMPSKSIVKVLDDSKKWWKVEYKNTVGYAHSDYLIKSEDTSNNNENKKPNGKVIVLDPGHGGFDPGAVNGSVTESQLTTTFANKTKSKLEDLGYTVHLTRGNHTESCSGGKNTSQDLICRVNFSESKNADAMISIHMNSAIPIAKGTETYYHTSQSKDLANAVHNVYQPAFNSSDRGVKTDNFYVVKYPTMPSILLEVGFITNPNELSELTNAKKQDKTSKAIADGIDKYFK